MVTVDLEPDTIFIVECENVLGLDWVECPSAESAYAARWQLPRDTYGGPTTVRIINVKTGRLVFST